MNDRCEACIANATTTLFINGQPWRFCDHHTNKHKHHDDLVKNQERRRARLANA